MDDGQQPVEEVVFFVFVAIVRRCLALDDVQVDSPLLGSESSCQDSWTMRFPSDECTLGCL